MGLFGKRSKTSVEKFTTIQVQSKIVKLSYLQTLAIDGGIGTAKDIAGETEGHGPTKIPTGVVPFTNKNDIQKVADSAASWIIPYVGVLAQVGKFLFGKKVSRSADAEQSDTGWSVVKTWNQPQFDIIRYAIGIKELSISQFTYEQVSELISVPWISPKEIIKISLFVDQFIPKEFPAGKSYIEYYIKPDDEEATWIRINPLALPSVFDNSGVIVPRIITFNTEKPVNSRLEESYITTAKPVKAVRFRAIFKRPSSIEGNTSVSADAYTPILKSYKLILTPRNGL